jgi:hypothetical protein
LRNRIEEKHYVYERSAHQGGSLIKRRPHHLYSRTTMSFSTHFNPFLSLQLPAPATEGTLPYPLIATRPSTPLPDDSAGSLTTISSPLSSLSADDNPPHDNEKPYPSINIEIMWNHVLQTNLKEDNGGLHAFDYHVVEAVSPLYVKDTIRPNRVGAWFMVRSGHFRRAYPSDETRLRSGVALRLEDRSISIHMLTDELCCLDLALY